MAQDLTKGKPFTAILTFSLPVIGGNLFQLFYTLADSVIVGRTLGADALAAVGSTSIIIYLVLCFIQGITSGFGICLGHKYGAKDETFTDESFNRHKNRGEENMYFAEDHHEAIVSHEVFDKVQQMLDQRGKEKGVVAGTGKYLTRYTLSGKIKCGECGGTFKRRKHYTPGGDYIAWTCGTHIDDKKSCKMLYITDKAVKEAFITLMEKLAATNKTLLKSFVQELKGINDKNLLRRVNQLDDALEKNAEQQQVLVGLVTSGILEPALFTKEQNQLAAEAEALTQEKTQISGNVNKHLKYADGAEKLMRFLAKGASEEFDDEAFTEFVDEIVVLSRDIAVFKMKCGLQLKERLVN